jgi:hypothetical protein
MMTGRSIFRSSGIGVTNLYKIIALILLLILLSIISGDGAFGEDGVSFMPHYKFEELISHFGLPRETETTNALYYTIAVMNLRELNISKYSLLDKFPAYNVVREQLPNEESHFGEYVLYNLTDESALFIFIEDDTLTNVYRMIPRCTVKEFDSITEGLSSPYDVIGIDKNAIFNPFVQWGPVSYHCLDDGTFRQVTYTQSDYSSPEFVVKNVTSISQNECLTILCRMYTDDMPSERLK